MRRAVKAVFVVCGVFGVVLGLACARSQNKPKAAVDVTGGTTLERSSFTDSRDGKTYRIVTIGSQTWMAENLNYDAENSRCYDDDPANCAKYGRLYDWSTVMNLPSDCNDSECADQVQSRHQGICPSGWHVPSDEEWEALVDFVGGESIAGTKLKSTSGCDTEYRDSGTDDYGFSALPGGLGDGSYFDNAGYYGIWWSATEYDASNAWRRYMSYNYSNVGSDWGYKPLGFSLRCLQDERP
jgi:uncharacterized protein (TIGR02145 family)